MTPIFGFHPLSLLVALAASTVVVLALCYRWSPARKADYKGCPKCKKAIQKDRTECPFCGAKVKK